MKSKINVSIVSYLNSYPFLYGIKKFQKLLNINISEDIPSLCAEKLINNEVDLGLVPVFTLKSLQYSEIISDYCIGSEGTVKTVVLFSRVPLDEIKTIYLDKDSRTSVNLVKILAREFWKISPQWEDWNKKNNVSLPESVVMIGDKTFDKYVIYPYAYDLSLEWQKYTDLPFVFACWVANKPLSDIFKREFNNALAYGIANKNESIDGHELVISKEEALNYLLENISYELNDQKRKALKLYLDFLK